MLIIKHLENTTPPEKSIQKIFTYNLIPKREPLLPFWYISFCSCVCLNHLI